MAKWGDFHWKDVKLAFNAPAALVRKGLTVLIILKTVVLRQAWQSPMYKSNMAENPEKQTAWKCRLGQLPPMILNPQKTIM